MDRSLSLARRAGAEAIAAFTLVFAGCGAIIANDRYDGALGAVGVSLVFGLVIMVMVYATGHLSGAHINPAVTLAFTLTRHFSARDAAVYVAAQLAGATGAALVLLGVWTDKPANLGATVPNVGAGSAALYEAVLTAFLMFVIMAVATDTRAVGAGAAIAIGGVIGLDALFGGPVTGASMNPARSFGPALVSGQWRDFWVYVIGPVLGAGVGALAYQAVRGEHAPETATGPSGAGAASSPPDGARESEQREDGSAAHGVGARSGRFPEDGVDPVAFVKASAMIGCLRCRR